MTNTTLTESFKWQDECQSGCYSPYSHSHNFTLGRIRKNCTGCGREMKLDAQIFGNELGRNRAVLYNAYQCECGAQEQITLYDGIPKSKKEIYADVEARINSIIELTESIGDVIPLEDGQLDKMLKEFWNFPRLDGEANDNYKERFKNWINETKMLLSVGTSND